VDAEYDLENENWQITAYFGHHCPMRLAILFFAFTLAANAALPDLKIADDHRHIVTTDGKPFFLLGDTAWELFHRLTREEAELYLKCRADKGFNTILAVALAEYEFDQPNGYGELPLENNDPTKPRDAYFQHVDWMVDKAASLGLHTAMLPTWGDKWNKKWGKGPEIFTPENAAVYCEWLARRYKDKPIIWVLGGDRPVENDTHRAIIRAMAAGFAEKPGDNGVNDFESFKAKGVWYTKPVLYRQKGGEFYEWDKETKSHSTLMDAAKVKEKVIKTPTGKFEFKSGYMEQEKYAGYISEKLGVKIEKVGFPQWVAPKYSGTGDLHFVSAKLTLAAEGRSSNLPHAISIAQPSQGGKRDVFVEINPETAAKKGIKDGDTVLIKSKTGSVKAPARIYAGVRPDTVFLPHFGGHWAQGRWAKATDRIQRNSVNEVIENISDPISGLACYYSGMVTIERA